MSAFQGSLPGGPGRNGLPGPRPYVYGERGARREAEVQRILAAVRGELGGEADGGPGPEWHRELAAERRDLAAPVPAAVAVPAPITLPALPAAVPPAPVPAVPRRPEPVTAAYCGRCGYLTSAIGHKITCGAS